MNTLCHRLAPLARPLSLALACAAFSGTALSQTAPGMVLTCPAPTSTGVTVDLSTAAGAWETQGPTATTWDPAVATNNAAWIAVPGATWIGDGAAIGSAGNWTYRLVLDASDPSIDLASATVSYSYRGDNHMVSASLDSTPLPVPDATFNGPAAGTGGPVSTPLTAAGSTLAVVVNNLGGPYGLAMQATLTFDCRAVTPPVTTVAPVPVDAPWALLGLGGLLAAAAAGMARRRR